MNTVTESTTLYETDMCDIETLIEKLGAVRANTNGKINISFQGSYDFGYKLRLSWERPMTEEEQKRSDGYKVKAEEAAKELRRQEYEKLKAEFENDV